MTELYDLLDRAAGTYQTPSAADVEADVARGQRALRRRRTGAAGGLLTVAVAAAAIPVAWGGAPSAGGGAVPGGSGSKAAPSSASEGSTSQKQKAVSAASIAADDAAKRAALKLALAAARHTWLADGSAVPIHTYAGPKVEGSYQPGLMPEGAVVQGGSAYALTIARRDDPDANPDSFAGKVVVMLSGRTADAAEVQESDPLSKIVVVPLTHPIDGATAFEVQYPPGLGWTDQEAIEFASSIEILPTARSGKG
jgi:hypothetical protein